ncbi:MAG TPA: UDP-N-acetylglucosamine--N-acetylmuramyl-(pentapeptide) pyrophosphoryl-undecaprenol N-acetylglucosamine transferase, partial [Caulobacteraceae bacterium]|nr:UDP-N-acetylglucosamine--N-acetylmuramyl-(pentapeptide) pyrophosphoryl-undecaprenol N-acetylglucosamine transferase [Caulobacteraceae bacterium]
MAGKLAVVAAGGTGGHLFPAEALAQALTQRGWRIVLATDSRGARFAEGFPAEERMGLSAATFRSGDPIGMARAGLTIGQGVMQARSAFRRLRPSVVVGFGGYPSLPAMLAAFSMKVPTVIHEQNAVIGRANKLLAPRASAIACAFPTLKKAPASVAGRAVVVGNPIRPHVRALFDEPYRRPGKAIHLLITGGSQGARLLSELPPMAIQLLPEALRGRLKVHQQTRPDSIEMARAAYAEVMVEAEIAPFFRDMASRLKEAHLVIGRAGASTCCELAVAGKPSILAPLKVALDNDQGENARLLE